MKTLSDWTCGRGTVREGFALDDCATDVAPRHGRLKRCLAALLLLCLGPWTAWTAAAEPLEMPPLRSDRDAFELFAVELLEQIESSEAALPSDGVVLKAGLQIAVWPFSKRTAGLPAEIANEYNAKLLAELLRRGGNRHRFVARETLGALVDEVRESSGDADEVDAALSALVKSARGDVLIVGKLRATAGDTVVVSYRAMRVQDGTIIAATSPRRVPLPVPSTIAEGAERPKQAGRSAEPGLPGPAPDPAVIESLQEDLRALGYDPGPVDGKLGPKTVSAIRAYQGNRGVADDGRVTASLVDSLRRDVASHRPARPLPVADSGPRRAPVGYDPRKPYCREYQRAVSIGRRTSQVYGRACLQPDGSWQIVD